MLEINANAFLAAATELRRLNTVLENPPADADSVEPVLHPLRIDLLETINAVIGAIETIGARASYVAAQRLKSILENAEVSYNFGQLDKALHDIESRFADELNFIRLFVIDHNSVSLLSDAESLLGKSTASAFPSIWFDCEEAAKCLCMSRPTASVFHAMRVLEIGIKAFARYLEIEDPTKPSSKNWGSILRLIKDKIDLDFPPSSRVAGSKGAFVERIYTTLDAIKNPWRNATIHVDNVYTEEEARHILLNINAFMQKMSEEFDEEGRSIDKVLLGSDNTP